jgi:hypothetical protein
MTRVTYVYGSLRMTHYFAVIRNDDRWGPFESMQEPIALLSQSSRDRGHTEEEAYDFFLRESAVEQVDSP